MNNIYVVYCGVFEKIAVLFWLFCYMSFVVMCGGASSTIVQQWGISAKLGAVVLTLLVICTVIWGLNGVLNALQI